MAIPPFGSGNVSILTVEAVIHDHLKWHPLFTDEELEICRERLKDYGYLP
jgi:hypothetical protein